MHWKRIIALVLITLPLITATGCRTKFVAGVRRLIGLPRSSQQTGKKVEDFYAKNVSPRVAVQDSAGMESEDNRQVITPELAARYRELAVIEPFDPMVRYNLGRLYLQQGVLDQATDELDMAASLDPEFTLAYLMLGRTLRLRGQYDLAIAKLAVASKLQPDWAPPYIEAGICWDQRGFHEKAREQYQAALAVSPKNFDVYNNMGYSFFLEGQYDQAIKQYKRALELAPDDRYVNNNIGMAYGLKGDFKRALVHFGQAVGPSAAHNNVGFMLMQAGEIEKSIEHFQEAVRINPESEQALANLVTALRVMGRYEEAEQAHQRLLMVQKVHQPKVGASSSQLQLDPLSRPNGVNSIIKSPNAKRDNIVAAWSSAAATIATGASSFEPAWDVSYSSAHWQVLLWGVVFIHGLVVI
ncbi:MAG: tetratricopeptide repeat protein [Acidobacteria bacterium]|nr:tetratricopeptide repeat protein [Acidobacteriota bacterium]